MREVSTTSSIPPGSSGKQSSHQWGGRGGSIDKCTNLITEMSRGSLTKVKCCSFPIQNNIFSFSHAHYPVDHVWYQTVLLFASLPHSSLYFAYGSTGGSRITYHFLVHIHVHGSLSQSCSLPKEPTPMSGVKFAGSGDGTM